MVINQITLTHLQVLTAISTLPDDAAIEAGLAAIYLGISEKTLARLRQNGDGPTYLQYPASGSTARNQKVNYRMSDLREWRDDHTVKSTIDAAVARGLAFGRINDLVIPQPFWYENNKIINYAFCVNYDDFIDNINNPEIEVIWVKWSKALSGEWKNKSIRQPYHSKYVNLLSRLITAADQLI